jgi:hypothetical protein
VAAPYLIRISVHPYIRKYILFHYGETFFVTERGFIPSYIENALEKPTKINNPSDLKKVIKIDHGAFIGVYVGEGTRKIHGSSISGASVKRFNEVVSDLIHEEMYRLIQQLSQANYQVDQTIREFQKMYKFSEDELPFENLKRWYYRERARLDLRAAKQEEVMPQITLNFFEQIEAEKPRAVITQMNLLESA